MTAKPMTCLSCQHGELRGVLFSRTPDTQSLSIVCGKGHAGTPKLQNACADFRYEPGTDESERPA